MTGPASIYAHIERQVNRKASEAQSGALRFVKPLASHADVLKLVTRSSPRTSVERSDHFRSLAVSLCFERIYRESVVIGMSG